MSASSENSDYIPSKERAGRYQAGYSSDNEVRFIVLLLCTLGHDYSTELRVMRMWLCSLKNSSKYRRKFARTFSHLVRNLDEFSHNLNEISTSRNFETAKFLPHESSSERNFDRDSGNAKFWVTEISGQSEVRNPSTPPLSYTCRKNIPSNTSLYSRNREQCPLMFSYLTALPVAFALHDRKVKLRKTKNQKTN